MQDLSLLFPHCKREAKFDGKHTPYLLNELAELNNCDNIAYFEGRKTGQDLYLWLAAAPSGPSIKFLVQNVHTMDELQLTGNCMKGTRPLLSFDASFDDPSVPQLAVIKGLLIAVFGVPEGCKKVRPYHDHVFTFSYVDSRIWFRNYEVKETVSSAATASLSLVEIGPRFVLEPIRILEGSFRGATIYENEAYVSPNAIRAAVRMKGMKYQSRVAHKEMLNAKKAEAHIPKTELDAVFE